MFTYTLVLIAILASGYTPETVQHFETEGECRKAGMVISQAYRKDAGMPVFVYYQCYLGLES